MPEQRVCGVIPAAGRGTRLGVDVPKILVEVETGVRVWDLLRDRLRPHVSHLHVVVSPAGAPPFRRTVGDQIDAGTVSVSVQDRPTGMGDAIFGAASHWRGYDTILVVWGDQVNLSPTTARQVVAAHRRTTGPGRPGLTLPLVALPDPYVEYELAAGRLVRVRESREGDTCRPGGRSDMGVFCLSTEGLPAAWRDYRADATPGAATGEVNFLPFLPYLSRVHGWPVTVVDVDDPVQARGINTAEDLEFARQQLRRSGGGEAGR